jgi:hypothetical protein
MEKQTVTSKKFSLDWKDAAKGFVMSALTAFITVVYSSLEAGTLEFDWKKIGVASLTAGFAYLLKNFFTPAEVKTPAEPK